MLVGCIWTDKNSVAHLHKELDEIKEKHSARGELKWQKVSNSRLQFFQDVLDWFFSSDALHFRSVIVTDKTKLNHAFFNRGSHEHFYYKLYYQLLHRILVPANSYEIYVDLKDTRGRLMLPTLRDVLCSGAKHDDRLISHIQNVHSREIGLVQLADFLLGAVAYRNRNLQSNPAKVVLVHRIEAIHKKSLVRTSPLSEQKFDVFLFQPQDGAGA